MNPGAIRMPLTKNPGVIREQYKSKLKATLRQSMLQMYNLPNKSIYHVAIYPSTKPTFCQSAHWLSLLNYACIHQATILRICPLVKLPICNSARLPMFSHTNSTNVTESNLILEQSGRNPTAFQEQSERKAGAVREQSYCNLREI